jgi:hypothetical protein
MNLTAVRKPAVERRPIVRNVVQRSAAASVHPSLALQRSIGNQAMLRLGRTTGIQTKLKISQPGDAHEREADSVAHNVMRTADPSPTLPAKSAATGVQRKEGSAAAPNITPPTSAGMSALKGGGSPLPASSRAFFEPRFGADLSHVRVHADSRAADAASAINARAFTVGHDIAFNAGQYAPHSKEGQHLLAHELTHVVQQTGTSNVQRKAAGPDSPTRGADGERTVSSQVVDISAGTFNPSEKVKTEIEAQRHKGLIVRVVAKGLTREGEVKTRLSGRDQYASMARGSMPLLGPWAQQLGGMHLNITVENNAIAGYASLKPGRGDPNDWLHAVKKDARLLGGAGLKVENPPKPVNKFENGKLTLGVTNLKVEVGGFLDAKFNVLVENANKPKIDAIANVDIKGMAKGTLALDNAQGKLAGQVSLAIQLKAFSGSAAVKYLADGTVDVSGKAAYGADKLSGEIQFVATDLDAANRFAKDAIAAAGGKQKVQDAPPPAPVPLPKPEKKSRGLAATGQLNFNLTQWFAGAVNVVVDAKGAVTVIGKIAPPAEIPLFGQKNWDKELIKFEAKAYYGIPVVGNLNLFANISLHALATLGPAKIYKIEVLGTYSTDPEIQKSIQISGSINISAYAGLRLAAEGGAAIEILSHDLKFGVGLNADVGVQAYAEARPTFGYREPDQFYISGTLEMVAQPMLGLSGEFFIELDAPWWSPVADHRWPWPLFSKEWPLSDPIGINATLKDYVLGSGKVPDIELKPPEFDPSKFMTTMVDDKLPNKSGGAGVGTGTFKDDGSVPKPTVAPKKPAPPKVTAKPGKKGPPPASGKSAKPDPKAQSDQLATKALKDGLDGLKKNEPYSKTELNKALGALKTKVKGTPFNATRQGDKWIVTASGGKKKKSAGQIELKMRKDGAISGEAQKGLAALDQVTAGYAAQGATLEEMTAAIKAVRRKFGFTSLTVEQRNGFWHFDYEINPKGSKKGPKPKELVKGMPEAKAVFNSGSYDKMEYMRQLVMAQKTIRRMKVSEWMTNREAFVARRDAPGSTSGRDPESAKLQEEFRERQKAGWIVNRIKELRQATPTLSVTAATKQATEDWKQQAALHPLDQVAGGGPKPTDMGDTLINSSIGSTWRNQVEPIYKICQGLSPAVQKKANMNVTIFLNGNPV